MNNHRLLKLTVLAVVTLLAVALAVPWHSLAAPALVPPVPGGPGFQMVNAFQFRSAWPSRTWDYFNGELFNPGPEDNFYEAAMSLPDNITITGMVVYFYDNSAQDLVAALWRFDPATGDNLEMATVWSSDAQDQYRNLADTSIIEPVIDQQRYSYVIEVGMLAGSYNTLRLAGVRIDYGYNSQLPIVEKNP